MAAYHVQDVTVRSTLDEVQLAFWVGIRCTRAWCDVKWAVECVSEDGCAMKEFLLVNHHNMHTAHC